jgi:hypothetical protein
LCIIAPIPASGGADAFGFVNEDQLADGSWSYIDEWRYLRKS